MPNAERPKNVPTIEPRVFLVGAGPGNPGLLTIRAEECLSQADLVLYDRLVPARLLAHVPAAAERICVTDLPGRHLERCPRVHQLMIEAARQGKCVVRLQGGDPLVFGRGAEEAEALRQAGVSFEIVPGITAALGAASFAGIPLTDRQHASAVALVTGHEWSGQGTSTLDWEALARFPGTLVLYMGKAQLGVLTQGLIDRGKPPDTPAAVVSWAATGHQRTLVSTLCDLAVTAKAAGITAPALTIIGTVVRLRDRVSWFEQLPLFGKGILVTRPRHQAPDFMRRLECLGAVPYLLPTVEVREPADWEPVDRALAELPGYSWLVFTSSNGVHGLIGRLRQTGRDLRALGPVRLAVIGPATAEALRSYHLEPDLMPAVYSSEALAAALAGPAAGQRLLLARADRGRDVLRQELSRVAVVDQIAVYAQADVVEADAEVLAALRRGDIRYITLTSSNIARSLARLLDEPLHQQIRSGVVQLVSISPVTSQDVRLVGWPVAAAAEEATMEGMIAALVSLAEKDLASRGRQSPGD